jgi:hypothetical protein
VQDEVAFRASNAHADPSKGALIPLRKPTINVTARDKKKL